MCRLRAVRTKNVPQLMDQTPEETPRHAEPESGPPADAALTRRALFGTVFGGVAVVAALQSVGDRFSSQRKNKLGLQTQGDHATPESGGRAEDNPVASPVASPLASPVASPVATPVGPATIGNLRVHRGESFEYDSAPVESDTLSILVLGDGASLNLSPASFRHDFQISASYLDPLLWSDDQTMEPRPWLAERWEWDDSGKLVTFHLRRDVRWHDDTPFQARDVVFSYTVYRDDIDSNVRNIFNQMESVRAVDEWTVEVKLFTPDGNWLFNAATQLIFQRAQYRDFWVTRVAGERTLADFSWGNTLPVGTGPWKVKEFSAEGVSFERNDDYFEASPRFQALELAVVQSREERLSLWNEAQGDVLSGVRVTDLPSVSDTPGELYASHGASVMFAAFNFQNPARAFPTLLGDIRIRRALSLAADRNHYADEVFSGFVRQRSGGTIAQPWAFDPGNTVPERDVEEARKLLTEAGLTDLNNDGMLEDFNGETLRFSAIVRDDASPALISLLQGLTADFRDIGALFEVRVLDPAGFTASWTQNRDYDLIAYAYPLYPGFTDFDLYGSNFDIRINPQGWNPGGYRNEQVDDLLKRLLVTVDPGLQRDVLHELQSAVNDDLFGLWFGFPDDLVITREELSGYQPNKYLSTWNTRLLWREDR